MKYKVGDLVEGTITKITSHGAFLVVDNETTAYLHISQISTAYIRNIFRFLKIGSIYLVKVTEVNEENKFLKVSLKDVTKVEQDFNYSNEHFEVIENTDPSELLKRVPSWIKNEYGSGDNTNETSKPVDANFVVNVNLEHLVDKIDFEFYREKVKEINSGIENLSLPGNDYLGWLNYPETYNKEELTLIEEKAQFVRDNFDTLVVCGIGGSYLGALAAINALRGLYHNDKLEIIFIGNTFSSTYIKQVLNHIENKKFAINVISKSGTTTETSISFRLVKQLLEQKIGKEGASKAIFATTDKDKGALKQLSLKEGYTTFTLPSDIGGRYSVLTAVGLFPIACAGINIKYMLEGAHKAMTDLKNDSIYVNQAYRYACVRDYLYRKRKSSEMFIAYEPHFKDFAEWFKQLFGESEGKEQKGLLPTSAIFSTDLHSLGQFIQEGSSCLFETILSVKEPMLDLTVPHDEENLDELNYLENKSVDYINKQAFLGTLKAHEKDGHVNNVIIEIEKIDAYHLGYLFYFFMKACAMSAYLLKVNPFNQPGVEIYKKNMFHLLGKEGY